MTAHAPAWAAADPPRVHAWRFSRWKQPLVRRFLPCSEVVFVDRARSVPAGATLALWGRTPVPDGVPADVSVLRLEDGFLRSVGLGADLVQPLSWVVDRRGVYFDATAPSDLEALLQAGAFDAALLARAAALRRRIVEAGISKYNVSGRGWRRPVTDRPVVLVVGQVEDDASLAWGGVDVRTNGGLLAAVRALRPEALIVYKPHPDVVAGLRRRGDGEAEAARACDEVVTDVALPALLGAVDELHTLTSLSGFEALLRGVPVCCHGLPFYAGWGLTRDRHAAPRRGRRLTLDELVCAALMVHPRYASRVDGRPLSPEQALDELLAWRTAAGPGDGVPAWRRLVRPLLARAVQARRA